MCYYARTDFACGDWKWGNMKERCPRQHRMGETCGAKLVDTESVTKTKEECKICQEIQVKKRRLRKELDNVARWSKEGNKFTASIEKAQREAALLDGQIRDLRARRASVVFQASNPANSIGMALPPAIARPPQVSYTSQSASGHDSTRQVSSDRHYMALPTGAANGSSNRHHAPAYTNITPNSSMNRHAVQYVSGYSSHR